MLGKQLSFQLAGYVQQPTAMVSGRFRGTVHDELALYHQSSGEVWCGGINAQGLFAPTPYVVAAPGSALVLCAGEFQTSGTDTLLACESASGHLWLADSAPGGRTLRQVGSLGPGRWTVFPGRFSASAAALEIAAYDATTGKIVVGRPDGSAWSNWFNLTSPGDWELISGDFQSANGTTSLMGYCRATGSVQHFTSSGNGFAASQKLSLSNPSKWRLVGGHRQMPGQPAFLLQDTERGVVLGHELSSGVVTQSRLVQLFPGTGWLLATGNFERGGPSVVASYAGESLWWSDYKRRPIEGYCWPIAVSPGNALNLHLSGEGSPTVTMSRCLSTSTTNARYPVANYQTNLTWHPVAEDAAENGCQWPPTLTVTVPAGWPSGVYTATVVDPPNGAAEIPFIVRPAPERRARLAVIISTFTWAAYNSWQGVSYTELGKASFKKPDPGAAVDGRHHLTRSDILLLGWLEASGYQYDVLTDFDLHEGSETKQYPVLILPTHPEYFTQQMFDHIESHLTSGGSLLYLGGNGMFERVQLSADGSSLVFRDGQRNSDRVLWGFRYLGESVGKSELGVLGVATSGCSEGSAVPFRVEDRKHFLWAGAGLPADGVVGTTGLTQGHPVFDGRKDPTGAACGWEVDRTDAFGAPICGIPFTGHRPPTKNASPPASLGGVVVLATGLNPVSSLSEAGASEAMQGQIVYYQHPAGGHVFSAGSITFIGSLAVDKALQALVSNVLKLALDGTFRGVPALGTRLRLVWLDGVSYLVGLIIRRPDGKEIPLPPIPLPNPISRRVGSAGLPTVDEQIAGHIEPIPRSERPHVAREVVRALSLFTQGTVTLGRKQVARVLEALSERPGDRKRKGIKKERR